MSKRDANAELWSNVEREGQLLISHADDLRDIATKFPRLISSAHGDSITRMADRISESGEYLLAQGRHADQISAGLLASFASRAIKTCGASLLAVGFHNDVQTALGHWVDQGEQHVIVLQQINIEANTAYVNAPISLGGAQVPPEENIVELEGQTIGTSSTSGNLEVLPEESRPDPEPIVIQGVKLSRKIPPLRPGTLTLGEPSTGGQDDSENRRIQLHDEVGFEESESSPGTPTDTEGVE